MKDAYNFSIGKLCQKPIPLGNRKVSEIAWVVQGKRSCQKLMILEQTQVGGQKTSLRENLLSPEELAQNLGLSPATLADWRDAGEGASLPEDRQTRLVSEGPR